MWKIATLSVAPFDWLEASYFYYRPSDLIWTDGDGKAGHDLDKGFNVKATYRPRRFNLPNFSIGIDDIGGTGYFRREYVASTFIHNNFKFTLGMGWGKYDIGNGYKNPLSFVSDHFLDRNIASSEYGGTLATKAWFTGDASFFGGFEFHIPYAKGLKLKLENDPFNYFDLSAGYRDDASFDIRKSDSNINFGLSMPISKYGFLDFSYLKGNTFNISYTIGASFNDMLVKKNIKKPKISKLKSEDVNEDGKVTFYKNLLLNLNNNDLLLQTSQIVTNDTAELEIAISSAKDPNIIRASRSAAHIASKTSKLHNLNFDRINVTNVLLGSELNRISFNQEDVESYKTSIPIELTMRRTNFNAGNKSNYLKNEFKPKVKFPAFFQTLSPNIVSHIGAPQKAYFGGIVLQHISEVQFSRNLSLTSDLKWTLQDNFIRTITGPGSPFLPHVRTDLVEYLIQSDKYISRMQLDYVWSPAKSVYAKLSGGIFEMMYGGIGFELIHMPFNSNFSYGIELYRAKKRDFDQRFNFLDYEVTTGHLNLQYDFTKYGIIANLSLGQYLAEDVGYTFDLSRRTDSGFIAGIFFTRTNVSAEEFGEGSFDKGFYFKIPFDLFSKDLNKQKVHFKLRPLTRDGGAKLEYEKRLIDLMIDSKFKEIYRGWNEVSN